MDVARRNVEGTASDRKLVGGRRVQIELAKTVAAQPTAAFEVVTAIADWPQIIGSIRSIEVLTPGPIRAGTRIREDRVLFGRNGTQELEVTTIERPHRLRLLVHHPDLHYELDHLPDVVYGSGCRMMLIFRSRAKTPAGRALQSLMTPLMEITLRDELERDLSDFANAVTPQYPPGKQRREK
jgi:hypothetical protein